jgi:hypothetical protein
MSTVNYNSYPQAPEVRRREALDEIWRNEV